MKLSAEDFSCFVFAAILMHIIVCCVPHLDIYLAAMTDRTTIPKFSGPAYKGWEYKVQNDFIEKELHSALFAFRGRPRIPGPAFIKPVTQGEFNTYPVDNILAAV